MAVVPPPPPPPPGVGVGTGAGAGGGVRRAGRILDVGDTEYEKKKRIEEEIHALFRERERKAKEAKATQIKLAYEHKASLDAKLERILRRMADIEIEIQVLRAKRETIDNAEMEEVMEVYLVSRMVH